MAQVLIAEPGEIVKYAVGLLGVEIAAVQVDRIARSEPDQAGIGSVVTSPVQKAAALRQVGLIETKGLGGGVDDGRRRVLAQIPVFRRSFEITSVKSGEDLRRVLCCMPHYWR